MPPVNAVRQRPWLAACLLLLAAHLAFGLLRIPGKVISRRGDDIDRYRREGAARFLLDNARLSGAETIEWLCTNVPANAVVLWRGESRGPFEILAGLIAPRLLVAEGSVGPAARQWHSPGGLGDRPLASGTLPDGRSGILVVEAREQGLTLQVR
jgi:hypothetical protein